VTAVFETMRVRGGTVPFRHLHAARLERSLAALHLPVPGGLTEAMNPGSGKREAVLRVEVGPVGLSVATRDLPSSAPFSVISVRGYLPYPHKTLDRDQFVAAGAAAWARGAGDALLVTADGIVAEGTVWSLFWWEEGGLATPSADLGILPGVASARIRELRPTVERRIGVAQLAGRALFAANAVRGVVPITRIDGADVPADPRTAALAEDFWP
jgi:branched-subunit amino acid aminotransferase/4-amino-4-deoxychorismate lyase